MNLRSSILATSLAASSLLFSSGLHAAPVGFVFTSNPDELKYYDGSTVYFDPITDTVVDWKMLDSANGVTLIPGNSVVGVGTNISSVTAASWTGVFYIDSQPVLPNDVFFRGADNDINFGSSLVAIGDPPGIWSPIRNAVPDSGTTVQLLGAALIGLAVAHRRLRRGEV